MKSIPLSQFARASAASAADASRRRFIRSALSGYERVRADTQATFADYPAAREAAGEIKWRAIENLGHYLVEFEQKLLARGAHVHWAADARSARNYILGVLKRRGATLIVKSKTMTSEEIHLNAALEQAGFRVIESDLGELIVQLNHEAPYHFVFPSMHLRRDEIKAIFDRSLGKLDSDDPHALTMAARRELRMKYLQADVGISGANFGIAELGAIAITENEGNSRLTCAMPKVHIALMGIEKIVPKLADLALLQPMLATCGTGQLLTCYNSLYTGPRRADEPDGPEEMHVVLLDNRRTHILADPQLRDALRCIRCGACLNVCPIFKNIGGHSYGVTYQGPIGAVIEPHLRGLRQFAHLSYASSLCGACTETCPVSIDLHHHLLRNRAHAAQAGHDPVERALINAFAAVMRRPRVLELVGKIARWFDRLAAPLRGSRLDPLRAWRQSRSLPEPPRQTFKDWWKQRQ